MASLNSTDSKCVKCIKSIGTFTCRGCQENFCLTHATEHRQILSIQMDENIISFHDQLQEEILKKSNKSFDHSFIKEVNQWEKDSIELIHKRANDLKKEFFSLIQTNINKIKEDFDLITEQLKFARNNDQFFENDFPKWIEQLNDIKDCLNRQENLNLQYSNDLPSLISNILIKQSNNLINERFQQSIGNLNIIENGLVILHNQTNSYASVRGFNNYSQGEHHLQFLLEHLTNDWLFIGIISSDAPIPDYPSIGKTAYGWSALDNVWRDGIRSTQFNGYRSDFKTNDFIQLIINCNQRKISLINKRTQLKYDLDVDINNCPLPWKLTIGLFHSPGERIRMIN